MLNPEVAHTFSRTAKIYLDVQTARPVDCGTKCGTERQSLGRLLLWSQGEFRGLTSRSPLLTSRATVYTETEGEVVVWKERSFE